MTKTPIDTVALSDAVVWINTRLRMHGGGIEVDHIDDHAGHVRVHFVGMCCGCAWKSLTWMGTVRDALSAVPGVVTVEAPGTRVSDQAEERFRTWFDEPGDDGVNEREVD